MMSRSPFQRDFCYVVQPIQAYLVLNYNHLSASLDHSSLNIGIMCFHHFLPLVCIPLPWQLALRQFELISVMGIQRKEGSRGGGLSSLENRFITGDQDNSGGPVTPALFLLPPLLCCLPKLQLPHVFCYLLTFP